MASVEETNEKLPVILDGQFFSIAIRDEKVNVKAKCTTCKKLYSGSLNSTANFLTHMKVGVWPNLRLGLFLCHFVCLFVYLCRKADKFFGLVFPNFKTF